MDLSHDSSLEYARDLFMFSFYTRGMSFIDLAYLKKSNLQNGFLSYRRKKTNQQLVIKWEKPMQEIIDKYDTCLLYTSDTLFLMMPFFCLINIIFSKINVLAYYMFNNQ